MNSVKFSLHVLPLFLVVLAFPLVACNHEEDAHLSELIEHLKVTPSGGSDAPIAQNNYEGKARHEMKERLRSELAAIGTNDERRTILEYLQREKVPIPSYLYQQAVVNHYLFEYYYADSMVMFDKIPTAQELEKESAGDTSKKKGSEGGGTKEQLTERIKKRHGMESLSSGFLADVFYVEAPVTFPATQLKELATKLRNSIAQPVTEESLSQLLESFRKEQKGGLEGDLPHHSKSKKANKNKQMEGVDLSEIEAKVMNGVAFNHQNAGFSGGKSWRLPPSVSEPEGTLVDNAGNLTAASERTLDRVASQVYDDLENVQGGHRHYAFYLKIVDIKPTDMSFDEVENIIILSSVYNLMTRQFFVDQSRLLREGDWSFYPQNLTDKQ